MKTWMSVGVAVVLLMVGMLWFSPPTQAQVECPYVVVFSGVPEGVTLTLFNPGEQVTVQVDVYGPTGYVGGFSQVVYQNQSRVIPLALAPGTYSVKTTWGWSLKPGFAGLTKNALVYPPMLLQFCQ